jgi:hypothetical protein
MGYVNPLQVLETSRVHTGSLPAVTIKTQHVSDSMDFILSRNKEQHFQ